MTNTLEFDIEMKRNGDSRKSVAEALCIHESTLSNKVTGKAFFTQQEMSILAKRWNLSVDRTCEIFFA